MDVEEVRKRGGGGRIKDIAQTLDGTETFETKKELFDYVISQLFVPKRIIIEPFLFDGLETQSEHVEVTISFNNPNKVFHF